MILSESCPFEGGSLVYAYLRHSPGDSQSIFSQEAAVREWCEKHGLILSRVFKDEARTGSTTAGRDEFLSMIDTLRQASGEVKAAGVVLWSFSRFARDYDDAEFYKADLRRRGYLIHSLTDQIPEGTFGRILEALTHWKDEERLREISKDSRRGLQWLAEQGYAVGGFPPIGYKKSAPIEVGKKKNGEPRFACKWEIDPECELRVRKAWQLKLEGHTYRAIHRVTRLFKDAGSYATFFSNIGYAGYTKCGELIIPNTHPAYISREDYDRLRRGKPCSRYRSGNTRLHPRRRQEGNPYILSGLVFCGFCGRGLTGSSNGRSRIYRCDTRGYGGPDECPQRSIIASCLHRAVCDWVSSNVLTLGHLLAAREEINKHLGGVGIELRQRKEGLSQELGQVNRSIKHLLDGLEVGGLSREIGERLADRRTERARLEAELQQVSELEKIQGIEVSNEALAYMAEHLSEELTSGDPDTVRGVLRKVLRRLELYDERIAVQYVAPVLALNGGELVAYGQDSDPGGPLPITRLGTAPRPDRYSRRVLLSSPADSSQSIAAIPIFGAW